MYSIFCSNLCGKWILNIYIYIYIYVSFPFSFGILIIHMFPLILSHIYSRISLFLLILLLLFFFFFVPLIGQFRMTSYSSVSLSSAWMSVFLNLCIEFLVLFHFLNGFYFLVELLIYSEIAFLTSYTCLCALIVHWISLRWFSWILCQPVHKSPAIITLLLLLVLSCLFYVILVYL